MGFKLSFLLSSVKSNDIFGAVLAGFGIWTTPLPKTQPQPVPSNVYPLLVIRIKEAHTKSAPAAHAPKMAGRMVISGRMSDVCAELDRLAA